MCVCETKKYDKMRKTCDTYKNPAADACELHTNKEEQCVVHPNK